MKLFEAMNKVMGTSKPDKTAVISSYTGLPQNQMQKETGDARLDQELDILADLIIDDFIAKLQRVPNE